MLTTKAALCFVLLISVAASGAPPRTPILLDTDIGTDIDDAFALGLVLTSPELDLIGVTTVSGDTQARARLAAKMLWMAGRKNVPVAAGEPGKPLSIEQTRWAQGFTSPQLRTEKAVDFLNAAIEKRPREIVLIAIGPLTNVAALLRKHPDAGRKMKQIVLMGGSISHGYGRDKKPAAEYNIAADPAAAQVVFSSGVPLLMVPLDVTAMLQLDNDGRHRVFAHLSPLTDALTLLYFLWNHETPTLFDPMAVAMTIDPRLCETRELAMEVDSKGFTRVVEGKPPNATVALRTEPKRFFDFYLGRVAPMPERIGVGAPSQRRSRVDLVERPGGRVLLILSREEHVMTNQLSRRECLGLIGAGSSMFTTALNAGVTCPGAMNPKSAAADEDAERVRRMQWWHEAKFGMFIHWGLYSVLGRHEWVMENEGIPVAEYEKLAQRFTPKLNAARAWARLAKQAGQKYMVMTTKHHEGFCNFNTKHTNYCATKQAAGRDLVREYVDAARSEGLRVGFYYSLMDWHHPDGERCADEEAARKRFVEYTHGLVRELMTNYGKIDILWYDVSRPLNAQGWESERMNQMVFELQPDVIVNNRNGLPGDFSTPEQRLANENEKDRAWEACMTMNGSWGYHKADDDWKTPKTVVRNLITCAREGGNYLLNIGPKPDGSIPEESVRILTAVGKWMDKNGSTIYGAERCRVNHSNLANFSRKGNTLYVHVYDWPGTTVSVAGLRTKVKSARLLTRNQNVNFQQDDFRLRFMGLPASPPDDLVTVIAAKCESEPIQDTNYVRKERPRRSV